MPYSTLKIERDAALAIITLTRPEKRNAISSQMIADLLAVLAEAEGSDARVVILTGEGKSFCSGMDLDELRALATRSTAEHLEDSRTMARLADFTLAVPEAKFGYTEVKIGFIPALVSVFLRRQIGEKLTRDLCLTGRLFDAA